MSFVNGNETLGAKVLIRALKLHKFMDLMSFLYQEIMSNYNWSFVTLLLFLLHDLLSSFILPSHNIRVIIDMKYSLSDTLSSLTTVQIIQTNCPYYEKSTKSHSRGKILTLEWRTWLDEIGEKTYKYDGLRVLVTPFDRTVFETFFILLKPTKWQAPHVYQIFCWFNGLSFNKL